MYRTKRLSSIILLQKAATDCRTLFASVKRKNVRGATTENSDDSYNRAAKVKYCSEHLSIVHLTYVQQSVNQLVNVGHGQKMAKDEKLAVKRELATTYYARCHSLLEEEYNHEKSIVEDRLLNWTAERLALEGHALFSLTATPKGVIFQDKIVRFSASGHNPLPFHRFNAGDTVKVSRNHSPRHYERRSGNQAPLTGTLDGVVLERRAWYIDVCINADAFYTHDWYGRYRLDSYVNKTSYDRMKTGLKYMTAPVLHAEEVSEKDRLNVMSHALRDPLLYTYPDAMVRLANSPGGLQLALPPLMHSAEQPTLRTSPHSITAAGSGDDIDRAKVDTAGSAGCRERCEQTAELPIMHSSRKLRHFAGLPVPGSFVDPAARFVGRVHSDARVSEALDHLHSMLASRQAAQLNASQLHALKTGLQPRPLTLIQGPPGTGKTKTACCLLATMVLLKEQQASGILPDSKILACAHSHVAADNLLAGVADLDIRVLRLGRPANVRAGLWEHTLDVKLQAQPAWQAQRRKLDGAVERLRRIKRYEYDRTAVERAQRSIDKARREFDAEEEYCIFALLAQADVVVTTCIGAGAEVLQKFSRQNKEYFRTVLVDEASQCAEQAILPALAYGCDRLILVGDQNQLPPVVLSPRAAADGLGVSMFSRLIAAGMQPCLLTEQYRMHPKIAEFSSARFYDGAVVSRTHAQVGQSFPAGFAWPSQDAPIAFLDISPWSTNLSAEDATSIPHSEEGEDTTDNEVALHPENFFLGLPIGRGYEVVSSATTRSYYNTTEAEAVENIVEALLAAGELGLQDIGVITPYKAQVKELMDRLRARGWMQDCSGTSTASAVEFDDDANSVDEREIDVTADEIGGLEVSSVDGFQGREKEVIIVSAVRSNSEGNIGFLKDWRRLNVAVTRAKRGLIVVGDASTLRCDPHWRGLIEYCDRHSCFVAKYLR